VEPEPVVEEVPVVKNKKAGMFVSLKKHLDDELESSVKGTPVQKNKMFLAMAKHNEELDGKKGTPIKKFGAFASKYV
jgi:hypothetical protein